MKQVISIHISPEELKNIIEDAVESKLSVVNNVLHTLKVDSSEAKKILGIKSHNTLMSLVKEGKLKNYAQGSQHPKFSLSEVTELKSKRYV